VNFPWAETIIPEARCLGQLRGHPSQKLGVRIDVCENGRVMTTVRLRRPIDGDYAGWDVKMAVRYPLALSEMRWPSKPLHTMEAEPLARWGIDIMTGWRG
jgi:hypothetical protein